jgi:hypothetical protein
MRVLCGLGDFNISSSVNMTLWYMQIVKNIFTKFKLIFKDKDYSKFNIATILGQKIMKWSPRIPTHRGLFNCTKSLPNLCYKKKFYMIMKFSLDFLKFKE